MFSRIVDRICSRIIANLVHEIGPEKIVERTVEKIKADGIIDKMAEKFVEKVVAECGFHRCTTQTGLRASPSLAARTAPFLMLPPSLKGGEIVFKIYSPDKGKLISFYKPTHSANYSQI